MGRTYRAKKIADPQKSEAMFEEALNIGKKKREMTEGEVSSYCEALGYLAEYAAKRNDRAMLCRLLGGAKDLGLKHPIIQAIEARLSKLQPE